MAGGNEDRVEQARAAIGALRTAYDEFTALVNRMGRDDLRAQSGSSEWTIADVLSHLGAGAEISLGTLTTGQGNPAAMPAIWDRWNGMTPEEKAASFVVSEARLTEALEALDADALGTKSVDLGFLPKPIGVAFFTSMRLSEVGLHRWDVDVAFEANAVVPQYTVPFILDALPNFVGFFSKPSAKVGQVAVGTSNPDRSYALDIGEKHANLGEGPAAGAATTASMPAEAFLRLTAGRLSPPHTPETVRVSGELSLDDLRRAFPGY
jgi:uncharacterized protein (TIGR03083 family)